jgi:tRNA1Val (adenine37-N6)-methyltransferase
MPETIESLDTVELLCEEKLKIVQKRKGYRFSIDAFLLANFVTLKKRERLLDIGTGCGIIPIYIAKRGYANFMLGVEIQEDLFNLALENKRINNVDNQIEFLKGDIKKHVKTLAKTPFNVVVSNPPYTKKGSGRANPGPSRFIARYESKLDLSEVLATASSLLNNKGRFYIIYPARRLGELVNTAGLNKLELKRLRIVYPRREEEANLLLAEFIKNAGAGVRVEKPLYIYENKDITEEVKKYYTLEGQL